MKTAGKRMVMMVLVLALVCGSVELAVPKYASAKAVSKVTKVVTLTKNNGIKHIIVVNKKEKVYVKVKILSIQGKAKKDINGNLLFGDFWGGWGKGTLFASFGTPKLKKSAFKKDKVLKLKENGDLFICGKTNIVWCVPDGVKNMKVEITYYTKNGKAAIKSLKQD